MIRNIMMAEYSTVSYLTFWLITVALSYIGDKSANEVRARVLFGAIAFPSLMYLLT